MIIFISPYCNYLCSYLPSSLVSVQCQRFWVRNFINSDFVQQTEYLLCVQLWCLLGKQIWASHGPCPGEISPEVGQIQSFQREHLEHRASPGSPLQTLHGTHHPQDGVSFLTCLSWTCPCLPLQMYNSPTILCLDCSSLRTPSYCQLIPFCSLKCCPCLPGWQPCLWVFLPWPQAERLLFVLS